MFCYVYMILIAVVLFKFGDPYPIIQNSTNSYLCPQGCIQCSTLPLAPTTCCVPSIQSQQACIPCPTMVLPKINCIQLGNMCQNSCIPYPTTVVSTTPPTPCCTPQNQESCTTQNQQCCTQPCRVENPSSNSFTPFNCHLPNCCCTIPTVVTTPNVITTTQDVTAPSVITTTTTVAPTAIKCPENTIKINNTCQPVFCGTGILHDGKCIVPLCPKGTMWTGTQCELPKPHNHTTINIINKINTTLNFASSHIMNFSNTVDIVIPDSSVRRFPCCTVVTPHTCLWDDSQYDCGSRSYQTCSSVCSSSFIQLRPPSFMPIPSSLCQTNDCYIGHRPFYPDCSNCYDTDYDCRTYCHERTICQVKHCQSIDVRIYCRKYPGSVGCREMDGCVDDWCT